MKHLLFILLSIFTAILSIGIAAIIAVNTAFAAIHGENNIWKAADNMSCLPWAYDKSTDICTQKVDPQLNNLIKRTGMTYAGGSQGTAFLVGSDCEWIISTKHTLNHINGKQRAPENTQFFRNPLVIKHASNEQNSEAILLLNNDVKPITDLTDRKLTKLITPARDKQLIACPEAPLQQATELKNNLENIESCILISFNQDLGNRNAAKRSTMTLRTTKGLDTFSAKTRGITSCRITGFAFDGMIETNCDSVYASSGSPFFCKAKGGNTTWQLTGTLFADTCQGHNNYDNCLNPAKEGIKGHKTLLIPITKPFANAVKNVHKK